MSQASTTPDDHDYEQFLGYFEPGLLAYYREQSDKYVVRVDDYDGHVLLTDDYAMQLWEADRTEGRVDVRFTFRRQCNGEDALAAFLPDLLDKSASHVERWRGFLLSHPDWPETEDQRFTAWTRRYLEGEWDVDNGVLSRVQDTIGAINALTTEVVGQPVFKYETNSALEFPSAENDHRYEDAHQRLYGYVIDGLNKDGIKAAADHLGLSVQIGSDRTITALKKALPNFPNASALWVALENVSSQRRRAGHSVREPAKPFPATETFKEDVRQCLAGLTELLNHLEKVLGMSAELASKRQSAKRYLPEIVAPPESHYAINRMVRAEGKTIERIEVGFRKDSDYCHGSEAIIIHFTDGSIIGIDTGSNSANLASDRDDLAPDDFRVDFQVTVVPPQNGSL